MVDSRCWHSSHVTFQLHIAGAKTTYGVDSPSTEKLPNAARLQKVPGDHEHVCNLGKRDTTERDNCESEMFNEMISAPTA